jgi:hypothetical protein
VRQYEILKLASPGGAIFGGERGEQSPQHHSEGGGERGRGCVMYGQQEPSEAGEVVRKGMIECLCPKGQCTDEPVADRTHPAADPRPRARPAAHQGVRKCRDWRHDNAICDP